MKASAPKKSRFINFTVLKALQTLNSLLILVNLKSLPALADLTDFKTDKIENKISDSIETTIIIKSNLFQLSSQYFYIPSPSPFIIASNA